jgi:hypothetical protein
MAGATSGAPQVRRYLVALRASAAAASGFLGLCLLLASFSGTLAPGLLSIRAHPSELFNLTSHLEPSSPSTLTTLIPISLSHLLLFLEPDINRSYGTFNNFIISSPPFVLSFANPSPTTQSLGPGSCPTDLHRQPPPTTGTPLFSSISQGCFLLSLRPGYSPVYRPNSFGQFPEHQPRKKAGLCFLLFFLSCAPGFPYPSEDRRLLSWTFEPRTLTTRHTYPIICSMSRDSATLRLRPHPPLSSTPLA